jgi:hypothetical protein
MSRLQRIAQRTEAPMVEIESASALQMADESSAALLEEINAKLKATVWWPFVLGAALLGMLAVAEQGAVLISAVAAAGAAATWLMYQRDVLRTSVVLLYDLEDAAIEQYQAFHDAFDALVRCGRVGHIAAQGWLFQDVHEGGPAHAAGLRPGDVLLRVNGRSIAPPDLPPFALGTDAQITIESANGAARDVTVVLPKADPRKRDAKPPMAEPTSVTARTIEPGVGYLRVAFFPGVNGQRFARELDRALTTLEDCSRLIVDLRGNLGGFVGSLRLMSHLTPGHVPVGYSLTRNGEDRKWQPDSWRASTGSRQVGSTHSKWLSASWSCTATGRSGSPPKAWDRNRSMAASSYW